LLISTALLLDSIIRNSVCTPAKLPCRRVEVGYEFLFVLTTLCFTQVKTKHIQVYKLVNQHKTEQNKT
jgi:hypothetical protein